MIKHLLLAIALFSCVTAFGQSSRQYPWEFGLTLGTSQLGGDLSNNEIPLLNEPAFSAAVLLRRRLGNSFALRGQFAYGKLNSDDEGGENAIRGWSSETTVLEPSLILEFEPFAAKRYPEGEDFNKILSPYFLGGVGYGLWSNAEADFNGRTSDNITADITATEDDNGGVVFPLGLGLKYYISEKSSLGLEGSIRVTGADLIDGVSASADPDHDDAYLLMGLNFSTGFGRPDQDKDGIPDDEDACPTEAGPESTMGCPDGDGDGIADKDDRCPEVAGLATLRGCPDGDGDGVADIDDECPTEAGVAALDGCPDGDGDGIADQDDACPTEAGVAALNGCPDGDGDGIADKDDQCPTAAGPARTNGCPDSDGDGIADKDDECPDVAGIASRNGCPAPSERPENLAERIARYRTLLDGQEFQHIMLNEELGTIEIDRIYFPTDISSLNRPDRMIIDEIDRFLALPGASNFDIRFEGHADRRASESYNQGLSERRSMSAEQYATQKGASPSQLSTIGFGESRPVGETLRENRVVIPVASEKTRMITDN